MSFFQSEDQIIKVLQRCFPKAGRIQIMENSMKEQNEHYLSQIIRLTINYEEDGTRNRKCLVLKVPIPATDDIGTLADDNNVFTKESYTYNTIIPLINSYLDKPLTPLHIKTTDSRIIILEDLTARGYEKGEFSRRLYKEKQSYPVIEALAHFHAASHAVAQSEPHLLQNKIHGHLIILDIRQRTTDFYEPILFELLTRNKASQLIPKLKNSLQSLKKDDIISRTHYENFQFLVFNHGDFRKDNIILKYGSQDTIDDLKFIDFQQCFWSAPIFDFMYFFLLSVDVELIENHFDRSVSWYLECLNGKLRKLNCNRTYSRKDFDNDMKNLNFCIILIMIWTIFLTSPLNELEQNRLLNEVLQGNNENIQHYMDVFLEDEMLTKKVLSVCKLCNNLGIFDA